MRVTVFHGKFTEVGGAEVLAIRQARYLQKCGDEVDLAGFACDPKYWSDFSDDLRWTLLRRRNLWEVLMAGNPRISEGSTARRIGKSFAALRPDVIVSHNPPCNRLLALLGGDARAFWYCNEPPRRLYPQETMAGLSLALSRGEVENVSPGLRALVDKWWAPNRRAEKLRTYDGEVVKGLDRILANSEYTKAMVERVYGGGGVAVVPPIVPPGEGRRRRPGLDRRGLKILLQTRMEAFKNVDTVLRGYALARSRLGDAPALHVVGKGRELAYLMALSLELGTADQVRFHGFLPQTELDSLRRECDVFALLPWDEPFGMVFPESIDAGLLAVGPDHGGPLEILDGDRYGWNVGAGLVGALAEVLERIWSLSDAEVDRRREAAFRACRDRYSPEIAGARFRETLCDD